MKINTTRFGEIEVDQNDVITFTEGLLGFENLKKFFIVDPNDQTLIIWLQSVEDGSTAFPIIEPRIFAPEYKVKLMPAEYTSLSLESLNNASIYSILTIPSDISEMSANLKAPIVINNVTKVARQIVLQDNKLEVRFPMYKDLKKAIVGFSKASDDSVRTTVTTVPLTEEDTTTATETTQPKKPAQPEA